MSKKGWEKIKLGKIGSFSNGVNFSRGAKGSGYKLINVKDLFKGHIIDFSNLDKVNLKEKKNLKNYFVKKGDIFFSRSSVKREGVAVVSMADRPSDTTVHCGFIIRFRPEKPSADSLFLTYLLRSPISRKRLINVSGGSAIINVTQDTLSKFEIEIPKSLGEQQKIAITLSNYDDLIENNTKRIELLEKIAKLVYEEWFVKFKFPGHEKVKMVDSELGKIPDGWEVKGITDTKYFNFINKNIKQFEGKKEYFATANIKGIDIVKKGILYSYNDKPSRAQKQPLIYSVWFARMKDTYKVLGFTECNELIANNSILSSGFAGLKSEKNLFPFLYYTINSIYFHKEKDRFATGATQVSLNNEGLSKIKIVVPSKEMIKLFGNKTLPILNEILLLQIKNKNLSKTRDLLLPKIISGEVDISNLDINIPGVKA